MNKSGLIDLLALHADLLNAGVDRTEDFLARMDPGDESAILFPLARRLKATLRPVDARLGYRERLYDDLMATEPQHIVSAADRPRRKVWVGAATVGSLLSLAGVLFWLRRHREGGSFVELSAG